MAVVRTSNCNYEMQIRWVDTPMSAVRVRMERRIRKGANEEIVDCSLYHVFFNLIDVSPEERDRGIYELRSSQWDAMPSVWVLNETSNLIERRRDRATRMMLHMNVKFANQVKDEEELIYGCPNELLWRAVSIAESRVQSIFGYDAVKLGWPPQASAVVDVISRTPHEKLETCSVAVSPDAVLSAHASAYPGVMEVCFIVEGNSNATRLRDVSLSVGGYKVAFNSFWCDKEDKTHLSCHSQCFLPRDMTTPSNAWTVEDFFAFVSDFFPCLADALRGFFSSNSGKVNQLKKHAFLHQ